MPTYLHVPEGGAYIVGDRVLPDYFYPRLAKVGLGAEADWVEKSTSGWMYGVGSYDKRLVAVVGVMAPLESSIAEMVVPGYGAMKDIVANSISIPTYYIWATPNAQPGARRVAGEWTLGHGGKIARDAYFPQFETAFLAAVSDQAKVVVIENTKKAPGTFAWSNVPTAVASMATAQVKRAAEEGTTSVLMVGAAVAIGAAALWLIFKTRK